MGEWIPAKEVAVELQGIDEGSAPGPEGEEPLAAPKRRRRRRNPPSPLHLARIERYRILVEERGWIFAPPSPPRPVSWLFEELSTNQIESLAG